MNTSARAPAYDLVKLIVAIVLLLLFLIVLWRGNASSPVPTLTPLPPPGETASATSATNTDAPPPEPSATAALLLALTATPPPPTATSPAATTTSAAAPTFTANSEPTITATPGVPPGGSLCELATSASRLQVGMNATILRNLNFRSSPGIQNNWLRTNNPGTNVEVVGGPVCLPYFKGVYVWWQIRLPDGTIGWSAEAPINGTYYFMEPGP